MSFDSRTADAYTHHLAEVNTVREVTASEDIFNEKGMLLVAKGGAITPRVASMLVRHKLQSPLTDVVDVADMLDQGRILADLDDCLSRREPLRALHSPRIEACWRETFPELLRSKAVRQKLTVLSLQLPDVYEKALMGGWFFCVLALAAKLPETEIIDGLMAALLRDIGYLHLAPELFHRDHGSYTQEEWRALQAHPVIARLIIKEQTRLSSRIAQAIFEHHERVDGSGYPARTEGESLSELGILIGFADTLQAQWQTLAAREQASLAAFKPLLQSGMLEFPDRTKQIMLRVLAGLKISPQRRLDDSEIPAMLDRLLSRQAQLSAMAACLPGETAVTADTQRLFTISERLKRCCDRSGLLSEELRRWCQHVRSAALSIAYGEMEEAELLLNELQWQFRRLGRELEERAAALPPIWKTLAKAIGEGGKSAPDTEANRAAPVRLSA